ncbi:MAG: MMPL family transporter, partial [Actinobacteria bacterium]|nr:MMPL family transporter [Actinomycetota bacterium]
MSGMLARVGASAARRPWRVVVGLVVLLMLLGGVAGGVGAGYSDEVRLGNTDSQSASDLLTERFPAASGDTATLVFHSDEGVARDPSVEAATAEVAQQPDVGSVTPLQVSPDGTTGYVTVLYTERAADLSEAHLNRLEQAVEP